MKTATLISFDSDDQETFSRLLPFRTALGEDDDGKATLGRLLDRVISSAPRHVGPAARGDSEPVDRDFLERLEAALLRLLNRFQFETDEAWWRAHAPALSSDAAIRGLADGRKVTLRDIDDALSLVQSAMRLSAAANVAAGAAELHLGAT